MDNLAPTSRSNPLLNGSVMFICFQQACLTAGATLHSPTHTTRQSLQHNLQGCMLSSHDEVDPSPIAKLQIKHTFSSSTKTFPACEKLVAFMLFYLYILIHCSVHSCVILMKLTMSHSVYSVVNRVDSSMAAALPF